jgi:hypothetical protein
MDVGIPPVVIHFVDIVVAPPVSSYMKGLRVIIAFPLEPPTPTIKNRKWLVSSIAP